MNVKTLSLLVALFILPIAATGEDAAFRFLATGDLPYSPPQESAFRQLLKQSESEDFAFLMHVGDFKAQSMPCSDAEFDKIRDLFKNYPTPVIYTPGDNEWTDCHGVGADPIERLAKLRELFFQDRSVLRLGQLKVKRQSDNDKFSQFTENYRFTKAGVTFIVAHVCGSGNNRRPDHLPSMQEFEKRNAANLAFLDESFTEAIQNKAAGVAIVIHANPDFENGKQPGFHDVLSALREFLKHYPHPVVCIHGDTHYYRIDKPLRDEANKPYLHFTRMEVFGSPNVAGVAVKVDPADPQVFKFQPYYLNK